jgi:hypothetical protein
MFSFPRGADAMASDKTSNQELSGLAELRERAKRASAEIREAIWEGRRLKRDSIETRVEARAIRDDAERTRMPVALSRRQRENGTEISKPKYTCRHFMIGEPAFCDAGRSLTDCPCEVYAPLGNGGTKPAPASTFGTALDELIMDYLKRAPVSEIRAAFGVAIQRLAVFALLVDPDTMGHLMRRLTILATAAL